jgi:hypothetical protein
MTTRELKDANQKATTTDYGTVRLATSGESSGDDVVQADDARLSDARTPTAHKTSHETGGSDAIAAANISGFDTQVRTNRLDQLAAPSADVSLNSHKLTNVTDPTSAQDAATKAYVDTVARGLDWKASVRVATTTAGTLATSFENGDTVDGVTLATGDRILIKDQSSGAENGIYTINASGAPTRAVDADASAEVTAGLALFVSEGTANQNTAWVLTTDDPITVGSTALVFAQLSGGSLASHNHTASGGDGGILTNDEHDGFAEFAEISAPSTPASGKVRLYPKSDGLFYSKDDAGVETLVSGGVGGGGGSLTVEEVDGSPTDSAVTKIVFPNGTLGIASHVATYTPAGGASGVEVVTVDEVVLAANQTDVRFPASGNLPTGYAAWELFIHGRMTDAAAASEPYLQFNGDTGANYDYTNEARGSTAPGSGGSYGQTAFRLGSIPSASNAQANVAGGVAVTIFDPEGSFWKSVHAVENLRNADTNALFRYEQAGNWKSTAAITSMVIKGAFKQGTRLVLIGTPKLASPRTS